jgi:NAD(P)-dependent dehydrogenase (short-subunit alcohol dehydrogenase family)
MRFEGKVALITGAGTGIGKATALAFAREGASVVIADIDLESAEAVAKEIKSLGREALTIKADVSNKPDVVQMADKVVQEFGKIDILVNNAGVVAVCPTEELAEEDWDKVVSVDLKGMFLCSQAVARQMIKQGSGKIVSLASTAAHRGFYGLAAYCASKGGVLALTRQMAMEWAEHNINVNTVSPSVTLTEMVRKYYEDTGGGQEDQIRWVPLGRLNEPEDVSAAILFLASADADNITGRDILIDGGVASLFWPKGER